MDEPREVLCIHGRPVNEGCEECEAEVDADIAAMHAAALAEYAADPEGFVAAVQQRISETPEARAAAKLRRRVSRLWDRARGASRGQKWESN